MAVRRIPLNFFAMSFGLAGLAESWVTAAGQGHVSALVGDALLALAGVVWLVTLVGYLTYVVSVRGALRTDLLDGVAGPFASLALISPTLLASAGLVPHAPGAGKVVVDVLIVLNVVLGAWFAGQWIYGPLELDHFHPGYFLPTVAAGLVASLSAAKVGQLRLAQVLFGLAIIFWLILGSMIMGRLFFRPTLPPLLLPTLAIEVAPAALATVAYLAMNGGRVDLLVAVLAGYGLLMALVQIRLLPAYLRLRFAPSTWAFAFSWAIVGTAALEWIDAGQPRGHRVYTYLVLAAVTLLVGAIAVRTVIALLRGELFPSKKGAP